jgi:hypothetical protein
MAKTAETTIEHAELLAAAIAVLDSGDDTGCDGVIVVGAKEYFALRRLVANTGVWYGSIENEPDEDQ